MSIFKVLLCVLSQTATSSSEDEEMEEAGPAPVDCLPEQPDLEAKQKIHQMMRTAHSGRKRRK